MRSDILWPLIAMLAVGLYLVYGVRSARQGKDVTTQTVNFMLALSAGMLWLFLVVAPVVVVVILLLGKFAPGALAAVPMWAISAVIFAVPVVVVALTFRSLRRRGLR